MTLFHSIHCYNNIKYFNYLLPIKQSKSYETLYCNYLCVQQPFGKVILLYLWIRNKKTKIIMIDLINIYWMILDS